ncbi:MAG: YraN family protein [Candidatus Dojkabacteria bacterium]
MNSSNPASTRAKGRISEDLALNYLQNKGYELVERNFTVKGGEIDLIMSFEDFIVFVEVKSIYALSEFSVFNAISKKKKMFLKKTIDKWLLKNSLKQSPWRLDSIAIQKYPGNSYKIDHFEFISLTN